MSITGYSDDTEVLTDVGWKLFKDIKGNDKILSLNPDTKELEYTGITNFYVEPMEGKLYSFKKQGIDLLTTKNNTGKIPIRGFNYTDGKNLHSFILPSVEQKEQYTRRNIIVKKKYIKITNWLEFFGFWLADGCVRRGLNTQGNPRYVVSIKQREENEEYVKKLYNNIGFKCKILRNKSGNHNYEVYSKQLWTYLNNFGTSTERFIPRWILNLNKNLLQYLLKGYTAGNSHKHNTQVYLSSVSRQLCDDIAELMLKVDGRIINFIPVKSKGNPFWKTSYSKNNKKFNIVFPKPELINYKGNIFNLELEKNNTLLVRRNYIACWGGSN